MCNLYKMTKTVAEVAKLFGAAADPPGNAGETVYPGYPGIVVADGRVRQMIWGFPLALYVALAAVAAGFWSGWRQAPWGAAAVIVALLLLSGRDEYDLVTWLAPRRDEP